MSAVAYLLIAVTISLVGSLVLWLRSRKPTSMNAGIEEFSKGMRALAPDREPRLRSRAKPQHPHDGGTSAG